MQALASSQLGPEQSGPFSFSALLERPLILICGKDSRGAKSGKCIHLTATEIIPQISDVVRAAVSEIGRTEDVRFSPDNRLLALAAFEQNHVLIIAVDVSPGGSSCSIALNDCVRLSSDGIGDVHGLDFIDDHTLIVANRDGYVSIIPLPRMPFGGPSVELAPVSVIRRTLFCKVRTPGSVAVTRLGSGFEVLVCNNYSHRVTQHRIGPGPGFRVRSNRKLLTDGLRIPDGVSISHNGKWIAVSSHETNDVKIYRRSPNFLRNTKVVGRLLGANYPHGVRFTPDDTNVLVADAGGKAVRVYEAGPEVDWRGDRSVARMVDVISEDEFERGRTSPMEGGPKGIDIDRSGRIMVMTCEEAPLRFFTMTDFLGNRVADRTDLTKLDGSSLLNAHS